MGSRTHAVSLLALGLALGGAADAQAAAPASPPPPKARSSTPPPPSAPTAPTASGNSPFLPTGPATTTAGSRNPGNVPPPPSIPRAPGTEGSEPAAPREPDLPPQDLSDTWGYSQTRSDISPRYVRTNDPAYAAPNPVGFYSGVSVQGNHVPPLPATNLGSTPAVMTWTGFERVGDGSRVFFQLSSAIDHEVTELSDGMVLRVRMRNTKVNVKNNRRRLDLRYFKTPVSEVKVRHKGRDTIATISLKRAETPQVRIIDGKAGYQMLVVEFGAAPAGSDPVAPPPPSP